MIPYGIPNSTALELSHQTEQRHHNKAHHLPHTTYSETIPVGTAAAVLVVMYMDLNGKKPCMDGCILVFTHNNIMSDGRGARTEYLYIIIFSPTGIPRRRRCNGCTSDAGAPYQHVSAA